MLSVISPAKSLDFESSPPFKTHTQPDYLESSKTLIDLLRKLTPAQLSSLMGISDKLAQLNTARYAEWHTPFKLDDQENPARQAIFAFQGDVYIGFDAASQSKEVIERGQRQLRILSGLYGLLRPLDLIQPYRLEMGIKLSTPAGDTLYDFWRERVTNDLRDAIDASGSPVLINLASNEYFKVIDRKRLDRRIISPVFKDEKNGKLKIISFYAKKARGLMAAWILDNNVDDPEQLKHFDSAGYSFNAALSTENEWVFTRGEQ